MLDDGFNAIRLEKKHVMREGGFDFREAMQRSDAVGHQKPRAILRQSKKVRFPSNEG